MAAPAAGEAPAIGALLASMALALAWLAASGMLQVWRRSLGRLLIWMADNLDAVKLPRILGGFKLFGALSSMLRSMVHTVDHYLGEAVIWSGKGATAFFGFFLTINLWMAREIADLARDVWHALDATTTTTVNQVTKVVTHTVVKPITKTVTVVTKTSAAGLRALDRRIVRIDHRLTASVAILAHEIGKLRVPHGLTPSAIRRFGHRLTRLEKATVGLGAVALVAGALGRMKLGWLRCPALLRMGKKLGCNGFGIMEEFLAPAFEVFTVLNLCSYALAAQRLARVIVPELGAVLLVEGAVCLGGGASLPSAHDEPVLSAHVSFPSADG